MPKHYCYRRECSRILSEFNIFLNRRRPPQYEGHMFCSDNCLFTFFENELSEKWRRLQLERNRAFPRPKLGTILMQTTFLTREQLDLAIKIQKQTGEGKLGEWLLRLGYVEEHQITSALARQFGLPLINLKNSNPNVDAVRMIPGKVARSSGMLLVAYDDYQGALRVAVCAPVDFGSQLAIQRMVRKGIEPYIADQSLIQQRLNEWYDPEDLDLSDLPTFSSLEELIQVGNEMTASAINNRAEDIQAELFQDFFWVRIEFTSKSHHHFFRHMQTLVEDVLPSHERELVFDYATAR
jgi:hypothetical protein